MLFNRLIPSLGRSLYLGSFPGYLSSDSSTAGGGISLIGHRTLVVMESGEVAVIN